MPFPYFSTISINISTARPRMRFSTEPKPAFPSPPARSLSAVGAKVIPISVTKVPTTTCGKSFKILSMKKDKRKITAPEAITEPNKAAIPYSLPIRIMGLKGAKDDPRTIGYLDPASFPIPSTWIRIAMPLVKKLAETRKAVSFSSNPKAPASISGTAMVPGHMVSTC